MPKQKHIYGSYDLGTGVTSWAITGGRTGSFPGRVNQVRKDSLRSFLENIRDIAGDASFEFHETHV